MLSPWLTQLCEVAFGTRPPEADAAGLREAADGFVRLSDRFQSFEDSWRQGIRVVSADFAGDAATTFVETAESQLSQVNDVRYSAKQLAEFNRETANQVEYTDAMIYAMLAQLVLDLLILTVTLHLLPQAAAEAARRVALDEARGRVMVPAALQALSKAIAENQVIGVDPGAHVSVPDGNGPNRYPTVPTPLAPPAQHGNAPANGHAGMPEGISRTAVTDSGGSSGGSTHQAGPVSTSDSEVAAAGSAGRVVGEPVSVGVAGDDVPVGEGPVTVSRGGPGTPAIDQVGPAAQHQAPPSTDTPGGAWRINGGVPTVGSGGAERGTPLPGHLVAEVTDQVAGLPPGQRMRIEVSGPESEQVDAAVVQLRNQFASHPVEVVATGPTSGRPSDTPGDLAAGTRSVHELRTVTVPRSDVVGRPRPGQEAGSVPAGEFADRGGSPVRVPDDGADSGAARSRSTVGGTNQPARRIEEPPEADLSATIESALRGGRPATLSAGGRTFGDGSPINYRDLTLWVNDEITDLVHDDSRDEYLLGEHQVRRMVGEAESGWLRKGPQELAKTLAQVRLHGGPISLDGGGHRPERTAPPAAGQGAHVPGPASNTRVTSRPDTPARETGAGPDTAPSTVSSGAAAHSIEFEGAELSAQGRARLAAVVTRANAVWDQDPGRAAGAEVRIELTGSSAQARQVASELAGLSLRDEIRVSVNPDVHHPQDQVMAEVTRAEAPESSKGKGTERAVHLGPECPAANAGETRAAAGPPSLVATASHGAGHGPAGQQHPPQDNQPEAGAGTAAPASALPWYGRSGEVRALGDMSVLSVSDSAGARKHAENAVTGLKARPFGRHDTAPSDTRNRLDRNTRRGVPATAGLLISQKLERQLTAKLTEALQVTDPKEWENHLRTGLIVSDAGAVVRARFVLRGENQAPARLPDPVLTEGRSKYGDLQLIINSRHRRTTAFNVLTSAIKTLTAPVTALIPTVRVSFETSRQDSHGFADEIQLGNRATNSTAADVEQTVAVELTLTTKRATASFEQPVADKKVVAEYPTAYVGEELGEVLEVKDRNATSKFDVTLGSVDTRPLENKFLETVLNIDDGAFDGRTAASATKTMVDEVISEKPMRDRATAMSASLTTNVVKAGQFQGYAKLSSRVVSIQRVGTADGPGSGIRNDTAETLTINSSSGHGQSMSLTAGLEASFSEGTSLEVDPIRVSAASRHTNSSQLQGQAKTAVIHGGPQRRYKVKIEASGQVTAERPSHFGRSNTSRAEISTVLDGEISVPMHQASAFEAAIGRERLEPEVVSTDGSSVRTTSRLHDRFALLQAKARRTTSGWSANPNRDVFPEGGFADFDALLDHLGEKNDVAVRFRTQPAFDSRVWRRLSDLQQQRGWRLFKPPTESAQAVQEFRVHVEGTNFVPRHDLGPNEAKPDLTYVVDDGNRVSHAWTTNAEMVARNPFRPAETASAGPLVRHLRDLRDQAGSALVTDAGNSPSLHESDVSGLVHINASPHAVLARHDLPDTGYVANIAGRVVWGWRRDHDFEPWTPETEQRGLVHLLTEASRGGLQLVVDPASRTADAIRGAVNRVNTARRQGRHISAPGMDRFADATAGGAGFAGHDRETLLEMLVTDRSVRIVDEQGVARAEFNTRQRPSSAKDQPAPAENRPVDTSLQLDRELSIHSDGRVFTSVGWDRDGRTIAHVRRALREANPATETPELVAGVGFGVAAAHELPGAHQVHETAKALLLDLINSPGGRSKSADVFERGALSEQHLVDSALQMGFLVPKLRAARGQALDTGVHARIPFGGRTFEVSVKEVSTESRSDGKAEAEPGVNIDHQVKGTRGGGLTTGRSWSAGAGASVSQRVSLTDKAVMDIDGEVSLTHSRDREIALANSAKSYNRLRTGGGDAFRPQYGVRFEVKVSEIVGGKPTRSLGRLIEGPDITLPAIVHESWRPTADIANSPEYRAAFFDVAATIGRTTVLDEGDLHALRAHPARLDFSKAGVTGLHALFGGLEGAVRTISDFINRPGGPQLHPNIVRGLSEAMTRANLPELLGREGMTIPLETEHVSGPGNPDVQEAVTVRAFLVGSTPHAGHPAPGARGESYREYDNKTSSSHAEATEFGASVGASLVFEPGEPREEGQPNSRRATGNRAGFGAHAGVETTLSSKVRSETAGSIDVSLLTDNQGRRFDRAHLVLEVTHIRQPRDPGGLTSVLSRAIRDRETFETKEDKQYLLVENSGELAMTPTLLADLRDPSRLDPPPPENAPVHVGNDDVAFATGFVNHLDDEAPEFIMGDTELPAGTGILGAVKRGLIETGLVSAGELSDATDIGRLLKAKYQPHELAGHVDDLLGTGVIHRLDLPAGGGRTRRLVVRARADADRFQYLRESDGGIITVGGQALKQKGEFHVKRAAFDAGVDVDGQFGIGDGFGGVSGGAGYRREKATRVGEEIVDRDIRRAAVVDQSKPGQDRTDGDGEEFVQHLGIDIDIFESTELPAPMPFIPSKQVPLVTLKSKPGTEAMMRSVIPRLFLEDGPPPLDRAPDVPATVYIERPGPAGMPPGRSAALGAKLADQLQAVVFPGLNHVVDWAPAALSSSVPEGRAAGDPPHPAGLAITTDAGAELHTMLANRNVRDNVAKLFNGRLELLSVPGTPIRVGARMGVIWPAHRPHKWSGLTFKESAGEPAHSIDRGQGWIFEPSAGGGNSGGSARPVLEPGTFQSKDVEGLIGDYEEFNRSFFQKTYPYTGNFEYTVTGRKTVVVNPGRPFVGLIPEGWALGMTRELRSHVVHPEARPFPTTAAERSRVTQSIRTEHVEGRGPAGSGDRNGAPLRLFSLLESPGQTNTQVRSAIELALATGRKVELAIVHLDEYGVGTRIEYRVVDPADEVHRTAQNLEQERRRGDYSDDLNAKWRDALNKSLDATRSGA